MSLTRVVSVEKWGCRLDCAGLEVRNCATSRDNFIETSCCKGIKEEKSVKPYVCI